ncbi:alginate O-acetyltransferase AlgX-related protein [Paracoccus shanxieyensis]|uniref:AlgX/AlgJ SGNH hydrolase-like domain-containing protein n=1 Tax=Paracoccus shanxieyensis TaxID=2675752 RepID=A0A6L6J3T3_9RHOB|nr:hypothetical protein [Paracoccus shanxieyensis]MTH65394.1 hypothetical protein [Paracoccus shanxieyensis]MTH88539.1 hypothetical protein [Paracoccus shanxieyensis]
MVSPAQVFIISHPGADAHLLQELLNATPGTCIRGANAGALYSLSRIAANLRAAQRFTHIGEPPGSPWYGAQMIDDQAFLQQALQGFHDHVLAPPTGARLIGFAETRHLMAEAQLFEYLDFLRESYPSALLVLNSRDPGDAPEAAAITRATASFASYAAQHPGSSLILRHADFIGDEQGLRPLFDRLGLPFDAPAIRKVLARENPGIDAPPQPAAPGTVQNGVLIGREGWLFLWGGSNDVQRYFTDPGYFTDRQVSDWVGLLERRRQRLAAIGATYRHLTVPDKIAVLPDHLGLALPHPDHHPVRQLAARLDAGLNIDILDDLRAEAQRQPVFYRTDTHWTSAGCQIAYRRICESLGVTPRSFPDPGHKGRVMAMDLGNKLTPEVQEDARFLPVLRHARRVADNAMVRYNESEGFRLGKPRFVGCHIRLQNDADHAVPQSVVIFGDSFSEFRPHLLTAMLAETFREVHFVWSTSLDHDFIARIRPDIVITEIAERFVNKLPGDDFRVPLD